MANQAEKQQPDEAAKFWRLPAVKTYTQRSRSAIYRDIAAGAFPSPVKLGPNTSAWIAAEIKDWCEDRVNHSRQVPA